MSDKLKIFIIEDTPEMGNLISMYLSKEGMDTVVFNNAESALDSIHEGNIPDLFVLDLNLPGMSGFDFLETIRKELKPSLPVVIVSARDADEDIIKGLGYGADEFVIKPFSPRVLIARIKGKLARQAATSAAAEESISFGDFTMLLNSNVLKKETIKIPLSTKEYAVLEYIVKNAGKTLSPEEIYANIWKSQFGDITAVAVYIQRLRKKIEPDPAKPTYIKTIFGKGYSFNKETIK